MNAVHTHSHGPPLTDSIRIGLVDESIKRSREGLRAVGISLLVLGLTAAAQELVYLLSGSVALLADPIHTLATPRLRCRSASPSCCAPRAPSSSPVCSSWPPSSSPPASLATKQSRA